MTHPLAGQPAPRDALDDIPALVSAYYTNRLDPNDPSQRVSFGTSGHRGSSRDGRFTDAIIAAITQAVVEHRVKAGVTGPLFLGRDTHALSTPAERTALEVLAGNGVTVLRTDGFVPTPAISHAILEHNRRSRRAADGIVATPSHNPPADGGFKYNPPHGGPAESSITRAIQDRANELIAEGLRGVRRVPLERAMVEAHAFDFVTPYVEQLDQVLDMNAIAAARPKLGVDPMGGAGIDFWAPIADRWRLDLEVVNDEVDPRFAFMPLDHDGAIRMDCSSPYAMRRLVALAARYDVAFGNDTDFDRHGIVCRGEGLMNPNAYLAVAVDHLFSTREWPAAAVGKTVVTSRLIDRIADDLRRPLAEMPVGFKYFVDGLFEGRVGFAGEESAGASFLRRDGRAWTTDKDGILLDLLAAEIVAVTGRTPAERYAELTARFGKPLYSRLDAPATGEQKAALSRLSPDDVDAVTLGGEPILAKRTRAPGNDQPIGGLQVVTASGWFAARPSGTEAIYKIYAESFLGRSHLDAIQREARALVERVFASR